MPTLVWPEDLIARSGTFRVQSHSVAFESPLSRVQQVQGMPGSRIVAQYEFILGERDARRMDALLAQLRGPQGTVMMWDHRRPTSGGTQGTAEEFSVTITPEAFSDATTFSDGTGFTTSGTPRISFGGPAGATTIGTDGWYAGQTVATVGDWVQIGDRLYMLTADVVADDNGEATLKFAPGLREDTPVHDGNPGNPTPLKFTRASVEMRLVSDDENENPATVEHIYNYTLRFVEVLV